MPILALREPFSPASRLFAALCAVAALCSPSAFGQNAIAPIQRPQLVIPGSFTSQPPTVLSPDGKLIAAFDSKQITIYRTDKTVTVATITPIQFVTALGFSPDSTALRIGLLRSIQIVDVATGKETRSVALPTSFYVRAFEPGGDLAVLANNSSKENGAEIILFDVAKGQPVAPKSIQTPPSIVTHFNTVSFSADHRRVALGLGYVEPTSKGPNVLVADVATSDILYTFKQPVGPGLVVEGIAAISADGTQLAEILMQTPTSLLTLRIIDIKTSKAVSEIPLGDRPPYDVQFSPDGKTVFLLNIFEMRLIVLASKTVLLPWGRNIPKDLKRSGLHGTVSQDFSTIAYVTEQHGLAIWSMPRTK